MEKSVVRTSWYLNRLENLSSNISSYIEKQCSAIKAHNQFLYGKIGMTVHVLEIYSRWNENMRIVYLKNLAQCRAHGYWVRIVRFLKRFQWNTLLSVTFKYIIELELEESEAVPCRAMLEPEAEEITNTNPVFM